MKLEFKRISGNDITTDFYCECPHEKFIGTDIEHIMKQRLHLYGYNDSYFFNQVNAEPREIKCRCGRKYTQQWFAEGYVEIKKIG